MVSVVIINSKLLALFFTNKFNNIMAAFFKSFRKGFVVCRSLDANLSGKVAKKNDSDTEKRSPRPQCVPPPSYRCLRNLLQCHRARLTLLPLCIYT